MSRKKLKFTGKVVSHAHWNPRTSRITDFPSIQGASHRWNRVARSFLHAVSKLAVIGLKKSLSRSWFQNSMRVSNNDRSHCCLRYVVCVARSAIMAFVLIYLDVLLSMSCRFRDNTYDVLLLVVLRFPPFQTMFPISLFNEREQQ